MYDPSRPITISRVRNSAESGSAIDAILAVLSDTYPDWELKCHGGVDIYLLAPDGRVVDCVLIGRTWKVLSYQCQPVESPINDLLVPMPEGFASDNFDDVYDWLIKNVPN
jgi:hypothetical protein